MIGLSASLYSDFIGDFKAELSDDYDPPDFFFPMTLKAARTEESDGLLS